jgi:hypothetical protein
VSIRGRLFDFADRLKKTADDISCSAMARGVSSQDRCSRYNCSMHEFAREVKEIASRPESPSDQSELLKLRQAVKDLTASSEKLREINSRATVRALKLEQENKQYRDTTLWKLYQEANTQNISLRFDLDRQNRWQQSLTDEWNLMAQKNAKLIDQLRSLEAANASLKGQRTELTDKAILKRRADRLKLGQSVRLVTEVLTGEPIEDGTQMHIAYEPANAN